MAGTAGIAATAGTAGRSLALSGIPKLKHLVFIVQENRSFDSYFGTFPGASGIPMDAHGVPTVCVPDPRAGGCVRPYHDSSLINTGGPHGMPNAIADINGGSMDGFVGQAEAQPNPTLDVMGYHDARELPTYWSYATQFTLQDHMFAPSLSWSEPEHSYLVSGWSAACSTPNDPSSCVSSVGASDPDKSGLPANAWTDITYLLHKAGVAWRYYVAPGTQPDCDDGAASCCPQGQHSGTREIWNPLPDFTTVHEDGELGNIQDVSNFYTAAGQGTLPSVSWIVPDHARSDHPLASIADGQAYIGGLVDSVMQGPDWGSTAIFITWDEWGGFYDHLPPPPGPDSYGYGIRVPAMVISPWVSRGQVDSQVLSFDAYLKLIEDAFLGGKRIDPTTDGRPDPRPNVRENAAALGDLAREFDFSQIPRPVVTGIGRAPGPPEGMNTVRIKGAGFKGATAVNFGTASSPKFTVKSDHDIRAVAPPGTGISDVTVTTAAGRSLANPLDLYTYSAGPLVTSLHPNTGGPGTSVTIKGAGFTSVNKVSFGAVAAESFRVVSRGLITAVAPPAASIVDVTVTTPEGDSPANPDDRFRYTQVAVTGLQPSGGRPAGCTGVSVSGWGFTGATAVTFGSTPAMTFDVTSDTQLIAVSPPGQGLADVRVSTPAGTSAVTGEDVYTYARLPTIGGLTPKIGLPGGGTIVVISGSNFTGASSVTFGGVAAQFTVNSSTRITAISPPGSGTVSVTVTTPGGSSPSKPPADRFTYGS